MHNINANGAQGSSSRSILITKNQGDSHLNMSNISSGSNASFMSDNDSAQQVRFSDFYGHSDHARAMSSTIISSKSTSGRSLVTTLATVKEPGVGDGEMKYDEDYHHALHDSSIGDHSSRRNSQENELSAYQSYMNDSSRSEDTANSFYRHPSHDHPLVHMRPNQLFPDSPGWQCDVCSQETFNLNEWAYISTEKNYVLCERCFIKKGFAVAG